MVRQAARSTSIPGRAQDASELKRRTKAELELRVRDRVRPRGPERPSPPRARPHLPPRGARRNAPLRRLGGDLRPPRGAPGVSGRSRRPTPTPSRRCRRAFPGGPIPFPLRRRAGCSRPSSPGRAGAELHGNAFGQCKVRFPWDLSGNTDDQSSPWLRVGQLALGGALMMPRVGFEVLVDHELGDRDRPLVVGHLYNGEAAPPYELPGGATRSSLQTATTEKGAGSNELRFEDSAGSRGDPAQRLARLHLLRRARRRREGGQGRLEKVGSNQGRRRGGEPEQRRRWAHGPRRCRRTPSSPSSATSPTG